MVSVNHGDHCFLTYHKDFIVTMTLKASYFNSDINRKQAAVSRPPRRRPSVALLSHHLRSGIQVFAAGTDVIIVPGRTVLLIHEEPLYHILFS